MLLYTVYTTYESYTHRTVLTLYSLLLITVYCIGQFYALILNIILYSYYTLYYIMYNNLYYIHKTTDEDLRRLKQLINKDVIKSNNQAALEEK